jgi:hypothetical protein
MKRLLVSTRSGQISALLEEDVGSFGLRTQRVPARHGLSWLAVSTISLATMVCGCNVPDEDPDRSSPRTVQTARKPACDPLVPSEGCLSWPPAVITSCRDQPGWYPSQSYRLTLPRLVADHEGSSDQIEMDIFVNGDLSGTAYYYRNGHFVAAVSSGDPAPTLSNEEQALVISAFLSPNALSAQGQRPCWNEAVNWQCFGCKLLIGLSGGAAAAVGGWIGFEVAAATAISARTAVVTGALLSETASSTLAQFVSCEAACARGQCYKDLEECAQRVCERQWRPSDPYACDYDNVLFPNAPIPSTGEYAGCWDKFDICLASLK